MYGVGFWVQFSRATVLLIPLLLIILLIFLLLLLLLLLMRRSSSFRGGPSKGGPASNLAFEIVRNFAGERELARCQVFDRVWKENNIKTFLAMKFITRVN